MKVSIVYWSGTGNTEAMANAVAEGAKGAGAEVELLPVSAASKDVLASDLPTSALRRASAGRCTFLSKATNRLPTYILQ